MPPATQKITTLIFDWDGTLMDSAHLGFQAFQKTFRDLAIPFDHETYEAIYSPNWYSMYEALRLPKDKWPLADELWIRHYGEEPSRFVEGGQETVLTLHGKGFRVGLVSSGTCSRVVRETGELGLSSVFEALVCNEQIVNKKPHPEGLEKAMRILKSPRDTCAYIGDSPEDVQMGKSAQVFTVGVRSDYPTSKNLQAARPDLYLGSILELLNYF